MAALLNVASKPGRKQIVVGFGQSHEDTEGETHIGNEYFGILKINHRRPDELLLNSLKFLKVPQPINFFIQASCRGPD
jgi:hypothetical protein